MRVSSVLTNETLNRGIQIESAGKPNAKASTSSATGLGQYLNQSWLGALYEWGPLEIARRIRKSGNPKKPFIVPDGGERAILDMRKAEGKPALLKLNIDILARDWESHAKALGKGYTDGDLYLCHFLGQPTAKKVFHADRSTPAVDVAGSAAADANPTIFFQISNGRRVRNKTCGELRTWAGNAMRSRWDNAKRPDWIARYYPAGTTVAPVPAPLDDHDDKPPVKLDVHERDDEADGEAPEAPEVPADPVPLPRPRPASAPKPPPKGMVIHGDPEIWWLEYRLKSMHYYLGVLDGGYGGKLAAAIAGFLNDRGETSINPPNSNESMAAILDDVKEALDRAEADGFVRPVTEARKNADPDIVKEVAPEAAPVHRNFITGLIATFSSTVLAVFNGLKDEVSSAWDFWTSNQDAIPDPIKSQAHTFLGAVPGWVWLLGAAAIFLVFAINSSSGLKKILDKVKTGEN